MEGDVALRDPEPHPGTPGSCQPVGPGVDGEYLQGFERHRPEVRQRLSARRGLGSRATGLHKHPPGHSRAQDRARFHRRSAVPVYGLQKYRYGRSAAGVQVRRRQLRVRERGDLRVRTRSQQSRQELRGGWYQAHRQRRRGGSAHGFR